MAEPSSSADSGRITDEFFWDSVFSELLDELSRPALPP